MTSLMGQQVEALKSIATSLRILAHDKQSEILARAAHPDQTTLPVDEGE